mmetsp:Transcript_37182/g.73021  ORF Transcript_37182/g.73021 Transcript_37182/m.73021 type:complete len:82 (-) Transcript_37182:342-587(-)
MSYIRTVQISLIDALCSIELNDNITPGVGLLIIVGVGFDILRIVEVEFDILRLALFPDGCTYLLLTCSSGGALLVAKQKQQ